MNQSPFFSIVIPAYNRAALIAATLESIWQQTYANYEVIVVDNCSVDNTEEVLEPFIRTGRITFIKHDQNYERARSRNTGICAAKGDFVTLLDSDDLMYSTNLEDAAKYVIANPEVKCFHNLYEFVDSNHKVVYRPKFPPLSNQLKSIAQGNFMSCIGDFIHREVYSKYRFNTDPLMIGGEDWDFWLRVLASYKIGRIEKINSAVVQHEGRSVNHQDISRLSKGLQRLVQNLREDAYLMAVYAPYLKTIEASSLIYLASLANASSPGKGLRYLCAAAKKDPGVLATTRFLRTFQIGLSSMLSRAAPHQVRQLA
jgi:glycosyltransferase involved in cell wall biosynthesis